MEQNRLKELILSIRKSKHNMISKAASFAQAIEDKGTVDMDTHELASIMKDAFTKRRKKEIYADLLSSIIGESASLGERPTFVATSFNSLTLVESVRLFVLGDAIEYNYPGENFPYTMLLTPELGAKWSVRTNVDPEWVESLGANSKTFNNAELLGINSAEELVEMLGVDTETAQSIVLNGAYVIASYVIPYCFLPENAETYRTLLGIPESELLYFTITYDGVDYTYLEDGSITIAPASATPAQPSELPAAEAPTFRASITNRDTLTDSMIVTIGDWQLGSQVVYSEETMNPYLLYLTADQASKISIRFESNCLNPEAQEMLQFVLNSLLVNEILSDTSEDLKQYAGSCTHFIYGYLLAMANTEEVQNMLALGEYIKIIITYDGVDYVYST